MFTFPDRHFKNPLVLLLNVSLTLTLVNHAIAKWNNSFIKRQLVLIAWNSKTNISAEAPSSAGQDSYLQRPTKNLSPFLQRFN